MKNSWPSFPPCQAAQVAWPGVTVPCWWGPYVAGCRESWRTRTGCEGPTSGVPSSRGGRLHLRRTGSGHPRLWWWVVTEDCWGLHRRKLRRTAGPSALCCPGKDGLIVNVCYILYACWLIVMPHERQCVSDHQQFECFYQHYG